MACIDDRASGLTLGFQATEFPHLRFPEGRKGLKNSLQKVHTSSLAFKNGYIHYSNRLKLHIIKAFSPFYSPNNLLMRFKLFSAFDLIVV
jgi:hypothetical protein